jgi:uncharacterized SAM-dependent methyltransferase
LYFFPGSTIGNFNPVAAHSFLSRLRRQMTLEDALLIGVDLKKDLRILEEAYNDKQGITAAFNKNILTALNKRCRTNFQPDNYIHDAFFNMLWGRIEMHLVSVCNQIVDVDGVSFPIAEGEHLHTEESYKYTLREFRNLLLTSGFTPKHSWVDSRKRFSLHFCKRKYNSAAS